MTCPDKGGYLLELESPVFKPQEKVAGLRFAVLMPFVPSYSSRKNAVQAEVFKGAGE
jgi:hypothetical protein